MVPQVHAFRNHLGEMGSSPKGICTVWGGGPLPSLSHDMLLMVRGSQEVAWTCQLFQSTCSCYGTCPEAPNSCAAIPFDR